MDGEILGWEPVDDPNYPAFRGQSFDEFHEMSHGGFDRSRVIRVPSPDTIYVHSQGHDEEPFLPPPFFPTSSEPSVPPPWFGRRPRLIIPTCSPPCCMKPMVVRSEPMNEDFIEDEPPRNHPLSTVFGPEGQVFLVEDDGDDEVDEDDHHIRAELSARIAAERSWNGSLEDSCHEHPSVYHSYVRMHRPPPRMPEVDIREAMDDAHRRSKAQSLKAYLESLFHYRDFGNMQEGNRSNTFEAQYSHFWAQSRHGANVHGNTPWDRRRETSSHRQHHRARAHWSRPKGPEKPTSHRFQSPQHTHDHGTKCGHEKPLKRVRFHALPQVQGQTQPHTPPKTSSHYHSMPPLPPPPPRSQTAPVLNVQAYNAKWTSLQQRSSRNTKAREIPWPSSSPTFSFSPLTIRTNITDPTHDHPWSATKVWKWNVYQTLCTTFSVTPHPYPSSISQPFDLSSSSRSVDENSPDDFSFFLDDHGARYEDAENGARMDKIDKMQRLRNQLKLEKVRWHSDRVEKVFGQELCGDERVKAVWAAVLELKGQVERQLVLLRS